jgi:hypothetical protein
MHCEYGNGDYYGNAGMLTGMTAFSGTSTGLLNTHNTSYISQTQINNKVIHHLGVLNELSWNTVDKQKGGSRRKEEKSKI